MRKISIQAGDFDAASECDTLAGGRPDAGAIVTFMGWVRGDDRVTALTLEHYPGMTEREIDRHIQDAESRWPILGATIIHRVGRLAPGDRIVLVAVASTHRGPAFEAAEFLIDYLKTRAPFWKLEHRGSVVTWVESRKTDEAAAVRWLPS